MRIFNKLLSLAIVILLLTAINADKLMGQSEGQRLSFGFNAGGVKYWGEFTDNQFWLGGDLFLRYNIISNISLNASFGLAQMRWKTDAAALLKYPGYFGPNAKEGDNYPGVTEKIRDKNQTRLNTYEITASYNFFPGQKFVPYIFGGVGYLDFEPRSGDTGYEGPLPNNSTASYEKKLIVFPVGVGFEMYLTDNLVFNGKGTLRITGTDYLDDLAGTPKAGAITDPNADAADDMFMTFGLGFSYYILGDADYDKDGLTNSNERIYGSDPYNPDTDGDGLRDGEEVYTYNTSPLKPDTDGDNLTDYDEVITYKTSPVIFDTDSDGLSDGEEVARKTEPRKPDTDDDGLIDGDEVKTYQTDPLNNDTDGDDLRDGEEVNKFATNPKSKDSDTDGLDDGDELNNYKTNPVNADSDSDGLKDGLEVNTHKTQPLNPDSDADGLNDGDEVLKHKTFPLITDSDKDGLNDGLEVNTHKTNPLNVDSDRDDLSDGDEILKYKTDPNKVDTDGDALNDGLEVNKYKTNPMKTDTDEDKLADGKEVNETRTNPLNPDSDGDKVIDGEDDCPLIAGVKSEEKGRNGCPAAPKIGTKTDFPDILFIVNTDEFNYEMAGTAPSLAKLLDYVNQCDGLQVRIEGHASAEGAAKRNQVLSDMRAKKVRDWLISQGVRSDKIKGSIGYGSSQPKIAEPTGNAMKNISKDDLEAIRKQNRRITVEVIKTCEEGKKQ
jgi:outer membrane protein OmpA-like peptidoglycan-associated protein